MKKVGILCSLALVLFSCGGGTDKSTLTVDKVKINGDSKDYISVVPGKYEITKSKGTLDREELSIAVKFKAVKPLEAEKMGDNTAIGNIDLQVIDDKGAPIDLSFSPASSAEYDKFTSLLKGKAGDEVTVLFKSQGFGSSKEQIEKVLNEGKGIEITSADITNPKSESTSSSSSTSSDDSSSDESDSGSGSGDCDQFCSDYESFADDYIAFMQKYKKNQSDPSILTEYSEMMQKASEMQKNAGDCNGDPAVAARLSKVAAKMASALR
jgi:hypothetical protein